MKENKIYLGLSSNIGERLKNLETALNSLSKKIKITKISKVYETEPVGHKEQAWFLNIAIEAKTHLIPQDLLQLCLTTEKEMGRIRKFKNGPRNIDIDLLFFEDLIISEENLKLPHPEIQFRNFVLKPLADLDQKFLHPKLQKTIDELIAELKNGEKITKTNLKIKSGM